MKNIIENSLQYHKLNYQVIIDNENQKVFRLGVTLENGRCDTFIDIRPEVNQVLIFTVCPTIIPVNHRVRISEFIARANQGLIIGNFELNINDGELRYKASFIYDDTFPNSEHIFLRNLFATFHMMDRYLPGVMSVVYANVSVKEAINQIEKIIDPSLN